MLSVFACHCAEPTPESFQFTFKVQSFIIRLNSDITSSSSPASFKRKLKEFLLAKY